jgi:HAD superfamily hydrolase (TIGR01509 family)
MVTPAMPLSPLTATSTARPDWSRIDIVLLDMDGTLLDLRFDNHFWLEVIPERYAELHGVTLEVAREELAPRFAQWQGHLNWYCVEFWTRELALDIPALKDELREHVRFLPGAEEFLQHLRAEGVRTALLTNAHPQALRIKAAQTGLLRYFDAVISSHRYGVPKEDAGFWDNVQRELQFDPARALFVDDSLSVLRAARTHGIGQIHAVIHPDSTLPLRTVEEFPTVRGVIELIEP